MDWHEIKKRKLETREKLLAEFDGGWCIPTIDEIDDVVGSPEALLGPTEVEITSCTIEQLLDAYRAKTYTAEQAVRAFISRTVIAQRLVNCVTEIRFKEAIDEAQSLDVHLAQTGQLKGPLHGIPVSVKDNIGVSGLDSTIGLMARADQPYKEDAAIVQMLRRLGAVVLVKSNVPSAMMFNQTTNLLWGRTLCPTGRKYLSIGGSSGGEAALACLKGTMLGVGSDLGGSVRDPACTVPGVWSIKPSFGRLPETGTINGEPGMESIRTVYGLLSSSVDNLEYALSALIPLAHTYDAACLPFPLDLYTRPPKLTIGIVRSDGLTVATPPLQSRLDTITRVLADLGHSVVEWDTTLFPEITELLSFYGSSGYKFIRDTLAKSDEPIDPHIRGMLLGSADTQASELYIRNSRKTELANRYLRRWQAQEIDALIVPVSAFPTCRIDKVPDQPYTAVWNVLDYAVATFPAGRCTETPTVKRDEFLSETDRKAYEWYMEDPAKFNGAAINFQLVCNRLEEGKCLSLARYLGGRELS